MAAEEGDTPMHVVIGLFVSFTILLIFFSFGTAQENSPPGVTVILLK